MRRRHRWFGGIVVIAFLIAIVLELVPIVQGSASATQATGQRTNQSRIATPGAEILAEATTPTASPSSFFSDPQQQYEIALLPGFKSYTVANQSILESADGNIAYSVTVVPTLTGQDIALTDAALAQVAQVTFQQGEGFIAKRFQPLSQGGIKIDWSGQVTNRTAQPLSGTIFAQQSGDTVFLLMIAATDAGQAEFENAIAMLPSSLRPL